MSDNISENDKKVFAALKKFGHGHLVALDGDGAAWMTVRVKDYMEVVEMLEELQGAVKEHVLECKHDKVRWGKKMAGNKVAWICEECGEQGAEFMDKEIFDKLYKDNEVV